MTVTPTNGPSWVENLTGLVVADAQNNFAMVQGDGTTGYFWGGQFISASQATVQRDFWQWAPGSTSSAGYWNWHSNRHVWTKGHWERERVGYFYHPNRWTEREGRWVHERSRWDRNAPNGDRDHDGVPNRVDRAPDNPRRY